MNDAIKAAVAAIDRRFQSGNAVPVDKATVTASEWAELRAAADALAAQPARAGGDALHEAAADAYALLSELRVPDNRYHVVTALAAALAAAPQPAPADSLTRAVEASEEGHDPLCMSILRGKDCSCGRAEPEQPAGGAVPATRWIPFADQEPPQLQATDNPSVLIPVPVLLTDNVEATGRTGRVRGWYCTPFKGNNGEWCAWVNGERITGFTHWADPFAAPAAVERDDPNADANRDAWAIAGACVDLDVFIHCSLPQDIKNPGTLQYVQRAVKRTFDRLAERIRLGRSEHHANVRHSWAQSENERFRQASGIGSSKEGGDGA